MASSIMKKINILIAVTLVALALYSFLNMRRSFSNKVSNPSCSHEKPSDKPQVSQDIVKELESIAQKDPIDVKALTSQINKLRNTINAVSSNLVQHVNVDMDEDDDDEEEDDDDEIIDDDALEVVSISSNEIKSMISGVNTDNIETRDEAIDDDFMMAPVHIVSKDEKEAITPAAIITTTNEETPKNVQVKEDDIMIELIPKKHKTDLKNMKLDELKEVARSQGVDVPKSATKAQIIALLNN